MGWVVVDLSIVQGVVDVVRVGDHIGDLLVGCVVTCVMWRDVMVLGNVVRWGGKGDLVAGP